MPKKDFLTRNVTAMTAMTAHRTMHANSITVRLIANKANATRDAVRGLAFQAIRATTIRATVKIIIVQPGATQECVSTATTPDAPPQAMMLTLPAKTQAALCAASRRKMITVVAVTWTRAKTQMRAAANATHVRANAPARLARTFVVATL